MATKRQRRLIVFLKYLVFLIEKEFGMPEQATKKPDLENNFTYHAPKEGQPEKYVAIREKAKELAYLIDELCPQGRERSIAMTQLETAVFWANAAIARNE